MASLAPSLTSSALVRPSLFHCPLRSISLRPSSSPLPLSLSLSLSLSLRTTSSSFHLTPLLPHTSGWTQQELDVDVEDQQLDADADDDLLSAGDEPQWVETQGQEEGATEPEDGDEDYVEPPEEAKLFVGGIPFDITSEKLAELFDQAGTVEVAEIIYNRDTDQSRGFGFVTMSTVEEADKAIEMFDRYELNGRLLKVNRAAPRGTRVERQPRESRPQFSIYVGNLSWGVDEARLEQVFSEYGKVVSSRVMYDRESGRSRGFGFVAMETKEEMDDAIAALDGKDLDGRALRVNIAEDRRRPSAF